MTDILLSIVIPVYNAIQFVGECLESALEEMDESIEAIIVDDGSTDGSSEVCDLYVLKYASKQIKVIHQRNEGVSCARNRGIEAAIGRYLLFLDADDVLCSGWRETISRAIANNSDVDVVYFSRIVCDELIGKQQIVKMLIVGEAHTHYPCFAGPYSKLYRREFINKNHIDFPIGIINGEDMLFNLDAYLSAKKYSFIPSSFYQWRIHDSSATHRFCPEFMFSNDIFLKKLSKLLLSCDELSYSESGSYLGFSLINSVYIAMNRMALAGVPYRNSKRMSRECLISGKKAIGLEEAYSGLCDLKIRLFYLMAQLGLGGVGVGILRVLHMLHKSRQTSRLELI